MKDFYTEIFINASPKKVWNAFVQPNQFFMAFFAANINSSFKIGERIEYSGIYGGESTVHIYGNILEYEAGKLLSYTDHPGPIYRKNHATMQSRVKIEFEKIGAVTRIILINDQFSENNPMEEEAKQWYLILSNLKTWIESGQLMDQEN